MRVDRRAVLGAGVGALAWPGIAGAQSGPPRFGLVVGNTAYNSGVGELRNAGADADLVAASLRACGFAVPNDAVVKNVRRAPLMAAVRAHVARVQAAGPEAVGFLYYAGHGAAARTGGNYLIPIVDAQEMTDALWDECVDLPWLFNTLGASPHAHIVALDACRNSLRTPDRAPGNATYRNVVAEGREHNTFISYSTWEGQTASDGAGGATNGPYALALAAHMGVEGQSVVEMFDTVRDDVRARTANAQEPMNLSRLNSSSRTIRIARVSSAPQPAVAPLVMANGPALSHGLVLGVDRTNSDWPRLNGPQIDCARMSAALRQSGYETPEPTFNPSRSDLIREVRRFAARLSATDGRGVGVMYYAGYGASDPERNETYLVPADLPSYSRTDFPLHGIALSDVVEVLAGSDARVIIFLDCEARTRRGLQQFLGNERVLVGYSSSPGELSLEAPDGQGGYFTTALVEEMLRPERRSLQDVLRAVSARVAHRSEDQQHPQFDSTIDAPIYFRDGAAALEAAAERPPAMVLDPRPSPRRDASPT